MEIPLIKPHLTKREARSVSEVILSTWITEGNKVREFENEIARYIGVKHAVGFFNGTVALHAALSALGIGAGDEVIVPSFTFFSTVSTVMQTGATPVFADISCETFDTDPDDIAKKISARTKAVIPVHYGGLSADMGPIVDLAEDAGLVMVEDAAEGLGAEYRGQKVGSFGRVAMFSFTPTKLITTGEGGVLTTDDDKLAYKLRLLKNHGQDRLYHHVCFGFNYRITEMQAALGLSQFRILPEIISSKRKVASKIREGLKGIPGLRLPTEPADRFHTYLMYTICLEDKKSRDYLWRELERRGITTRIYFPPVHLQPVFRKRAVHLPVTETVSGTCLSIPCYASMTDREIAYMTGQIKAILRGRQ